MNNQNVNKEIFEEFRRIDKKKRNNTLAVIGIVTGVIALFSYVLIKELKSKDQTNNTLNHQLEENSKITNKLIEVSSDPISEPVIEPIPNVKTPQVKLALEFIEVQPKIPFKWGGKTTEGFDSSGFVAYILSETKNLRNYKEYWSGSLKDKFGLNTNKEELNEGDIVFYSSGVCMFYIGDGKCIGMIPGGISILKLENFWEYQGFGKI